MSTMQEAGTNWDNSLIGQIIIVGPTMLDDYAEIIENYLNEQPSSWAGLHTLEEMLEGIELGIYTPWLYRDRKGYRGMILTSLQNYYWGGSVKIEFLSCKNFYTMTKMQEALEKRAVALGRYFIEATAHPTLAEYAVRKCNWTVPGVAIRKDLRVGRRN